MDKPRLRHRLSNVDLPNRTATCAVCGDTQIYVYENPKLSRTEVKCINKMRENNRAVQERIKQQRHLQNPNLKKRHQVSDIDLETMTGICSVCGPTKVYKRTVQSKNYIAYICGMKERDYHRQWRKHRIQRTFKSSSFISLTREDRRRIIDKYKIENGCKRCGYNADAAELELHFSDLDEREFTISNLVHFERKRLRHLLKISDVYCVSCHSLIHDGFVCGP